MKKYTVAVLKGDGIGPEVVTQAVAALDTAANAFGFTIEYNEALIGGSAIDYTGLPLPHDTVRACRSADAVLLGAVGGVKWDDLPGDLRPEAGLLGIRLALGLFANLRPALIFEPLKDASPLRSSADALDIMVVRELTGGIYFGDRSIGVDDKGVRYAYDTERYTEPEIERIARVGFRLAASRRGRLCSVDKANVLDSSRLWREVVTAMAPEYPQVELTHMYADNCAMQLVRDPTQFDVIVTSNMFGDILSDEASMITGSIGMLPSASLAQGRFGLYEPVHGSAPDIAGTDTANPCAAILSAAMLMRWSLGEDTAADAIERAVRQVLTELHTPDILAPGYKKSGCAEMGKRICELIVAN